MPKWPPNSSRRWSFRAPEHRRRGSAALVAVLRGYQVIVRPVLPPSCRFVPSCSDFAIEALREHGAWVGSGLSLRRLARCHPWHAGGYDPVPHRRG